MAERKFRDGGPRRCENNWNIRVCVRRAKLVSQLTQHVVGDSLSTRSCPANDVKLCQYETQHLGRRKSAILRKCTKKIMCCLALKDAINLRRNPLTIDDKADMVGPP
ncbi:MAG TPA: hypothetical protein VLJ80_05365 [Solirubrobacteraceae bacterium]|nr:hypothetical protein [Solirubrobacteraceae bacterium]